jgi:hypothetical protein
MIVIENDGLKVDIVRHGAEVRKVTVGKIVESGC